MFIGGGSAGTAGGIKVTTFVLLLFVILAEVRGQHRVNAFDRQIDDRAMRQALTVALLSVAAVVGTTLVLAQSTSHATHEVLFEVTSAFATVGLSTGITAELPLAGQMLLVGLMFLGRVGPITLVSALALRERQLITNYQKGGRSLANRKTTEGVVVIGLGRFGKSLALELDGGRHRGPRDRRRPQHRGVPLRPTHPRRHRRLHQRGRHAPARRARVRPRRHRRRQRPRGQHPVRLRRLRLGVPQRLGQGHQQRPRRDPPPDRRPSRRTPRTRHGQTGGAPRARPHAGLHRVRRRLRHRQDPPPRSIHGIPLGDTQIRSTYGVTIVGVKRAGQDFTYATADTVVEQGDLIIVSGPQDRVEKFSELA